MVYSYPHLAGRHHPGTTAPTLRTASALRQTNTDTDTELDLGNWQIADADVQQYLAAVGDGLPIYQAAGIAPPLLLAARVVGRLLELLALPDGTIHSLQDVETVNPPAIGARVVAAAVVAPARERGGMRFLTVNYRITDADSGAELQRGRTTVLLPATADDADADAG